MARVLGFLIRYFSNYYTLRRSDLAARAAPLDPRLSTLWISYHTWKSYINKEKFFLTFTILTRRLLYVMDVSWTYRIRYRTFSIVRVLEKNYIIPVEIKHSFNNWIKIFSLFIIIYILMSREKLIHNHCVFWFSVLLW